MDCEVNLDSIRALDERIGTYERTVIKLKRARNLLLNVSKLPPEVLGNIFYRNVTLEGDFGGLDEGSHNFLLVCHHWFEVASRTPDLWSFWGNTRKDWARWSHRSRTAPLNLVLNSDDYKDSHLDTTLCNTLRDRATRDTIRRVHLKARDPVLLSSTVAQVTANREELRSNSMECAHTPGESGIILGSDWVFAIGVTFCNGGSGILNPSQSFIVSLPEGRHWSPDEGETALYHGVAAR